MGLQIPIEEGLDENRGVKVRGCLKGRQQSRASYETRSATVRARRGGQCPVPVRFYRRESSGRHRCAGWELTSPRAVVPQRCIAPLCGVGALGVVQCWAVPAAVWPDVA